MSNRFTRTGSNSITGLIQQGANVIITGNGTIFDPYIISAVTSGGTVTSVGTGVGLTGGPITSSGTISLDLTRVATSSITGLLSSTDWTTFNAKQNALTFSTGLTNTSGTVTANLSTGVAGGQSVIGGTASGNSLTLSSTSNATKGSILFGTSGYDEVNNRLGIGTTTPNTQIDATGWAGSRTGLWAGTTSWSAGVPQNGIRLTISGSSGFYDVGSGAAWSHIFRTSGATRLTIGDTATIVSGSLGIGTGATVNTQLEATNWITSRTGLGAGATAWSAGVPLNGWRITMSGAAAQYNVHSGLGGSHVFLTNSVTRLTIADSTITSTLNLTMTGGTNFVFGTVTGTRIGTATNQLLGFWNATPIAQPTTAVASATIASPGGGVNIKTDDTFDGYTVAQAIRAMRLEGLLA